MPPFQAGVPRHPDAGRKAGSRNKSTLYARDGLKNAIQTCREGGKDPIAIMIGASRFLDMVAAAHAQGLTSVDAVLKASKNDLNFIRKFLVDASMIAYKAAEFGYAKLSRIDHVGDAPAPLVENRTLFVLNVGNEPGRPVTLNGTPVASQVTIGADGHGDGVNRARDQDDRDDD